MTVRDDLATLRISIRDWVHDPEAAAALSRVEAEIARLEQKNQRVLDTIRSEAIQTIQAREFASEQFQRAEAAEAERDQALKDAAGYLAHLHRLRDALRLFSIECGHPFRADGSCPWCNARALLADQDGAA